MTPQWWGIYPILALYFLNVPWLLYLGRPWAAGYWLGAGWITICAMRELLK